MSLSQTLLTILCKKLKVQSSLLNEEIHHIKILKEQVNYLKKIKENNYRDVFHKESLNNTNSTNQSLIIVYIITISFLKANTTVSLSDAYGVVKLSYSAGDIGLSGKQKRKRRIAISKLFTLIFQKVDSLKRKPIAIHMNNVGSHKNFILTKLKKVFYVRVIKNFTLLPYNGCRKRKLRRKKYTKRFK